jgi:hypothetical protein
VASGGAAISSTLRRARQAALGEKPNTPSPAV